MILYKGFPFLDDGKLFYNIEAFGKKKRCVISSHVSCAIITLVETLSVAIIAHKIDKNSILSRYFSTKLIFWEVGYQFFWKVPWQNWFFVNFESVDYNALKIVSTSVQYHDLNFSHIRVVWWSLLQPRNPITSFIKWWQAYTLKKGNN